MHALFPQNWGSYNVLNMFSLNDLQLLLLTISIITRQSIHVGWATQRFLYTNAQLITGKKCSKSETKQRPIILALKESEIKLCGVNKYQIAWKIFKSLSITLNVKNFVIVSTYEMQTCNKLVVANKHL